jgi:hypothetical protein
MALLPSIKLAGSCYRNLSATRCSFEPGTPWKLRVPRIALCYVRAGEELGFIRSREFGFSVPANPFRRKLRMMYYDRFAASANLASWVIFLCERDERRSAGEMVFR